MSILPLVIAPDPRLKTKSAPVKAVTDEIRALAMDMLHTMYHSRGVGLAAVQVGVMLRVIVADVEWKDSGEPGTQWVLVNPEIISSEEEINVYNEGCLSFPDQYAEVERPAGVRVRFTSLEGNVQEETIDGLLATCIQHEIDHINGITFVDHISRLKREMILKKLTKLKKQGAFDHDHSSCGHDHSHDHGHDHVHDEHCDH